MFEDHESRPRELYSLTAEEAVIGSLLLNNDIIHDVAAIIKKDDFGIPSNRDYFGAITHLIEKGMPADVVTVTDLLQAHNRGSDETLSILAGMARNTPSTRNAAAYAQVIRDKRKERDMIKVARDIQDAIMAKDGASTEERIQRAESAFSAVKSQDTASTQTDMKSALKDYADHLEWIFENPGPHGIQTGFSAIDERICGLNPGEFIVIGGRPGMGKTTYGMGIIANIAAAGRRAKVFSCEMPTRQLTQRMVAAQGRIPLSALKDASALGNPEHSAKFMHAFKKVSGFDLVIDDQGGIDIADLCSRARKSNAEKKLDVILIDYLQLVNDRSAGHSRFDVVSAVSRKLKALAKELECTVIALSQLSRKVEERSTKDRRPIVSDLRESGQIEQDADVIQFVYRDEVYNEDTNRKGILEVITGKFRDGVPGTDCLQWVGSCNLIQDLDPQAFAAINQPEPKKSSGFAGY